jgi:hypothetical protein
MYQPSKKQRRVVLRAIVYIFMMMSIIGVVTVLVFVMLGYRFNRATSTIQQGGLVQFGSRPSGANITVGKAKLANPTSTKITLDPQSYRVKMERSGYLPWLKDVEVNAGRVLWLNYAQLVPKNIQTSALTSFSTISQVKSSPNGKYFAVIENASKPTITFVDISGDTPKQTQLSLPQSKLPAGTASYAIDSWSDDSQRLLITATVKKQTGWLLTKIDDAKQTVDLSSTYDSDLRSVQFDPRSSQRLATITSKGILRLIDTSNQSVSPILATNVQSLNYYGNDALLFVRTESASEKSVNYLTFNTTKTRELKRVQTDKPVLAAADAYFSQPYLAISTGPLLEVYQLNNLPPSDAEDAISMSLLSSVALPSQPSNLSLRTSGRFVIAQYPNGIATYDIELAKSTLTSLKDTPSTELRWLDRYHFYVTNTQFLNVMEFDGANQHKIVNLTTDFDALQSNDGKYIYSITKTDKGYSLQRSRMILS